MRRVSDDIQLFSAVTAVAIRLFDNVSKKRELRKSREERRPKQLQLLGGAEGEDSTSTAASSPPPPPPPRPTFSSPALRDKAFT